MCITGITCLCTGCVNFANKLCTAGMITCILVTINGYGLGDSTTRALSLINRFRYTCAGRYKSALLSVAVLSSRGNGSLFNIATNSTSSFLFTGCTASCILGCRPIAVSMRIGISRARNLSGIDLLRQPRYRIGKGGCINRLCGYRAGCLGRFRSNRCSRSLGVSARAATLCSIGGLAVTLVGYCTVGVTSCTSVVTAVTGGITCIVPSVIRLTGEATADGALVTVLILVNLDVRTAVGVITRSGNHFGVNVLTTGANSLLFTGFTASCILGRYPFTVIMRKSFAFSIGKVRISLFAATTTIVVNRLFRTCSSVLQILRTRILLDVIMRCSTLISTTIVTVSVACVSPRVFILSTLVTARALFPVAIFIGCPCIVVMRYGTCIATAVVTVGVTIAAPVVRTFTLPDSTLNITTLFPVTVSAVLPITKVMRYNACRPTDITDRIALMIKGVLRTSVIHILSCICCRRSSIGHSRRPTAKRILLVILIIISRKIGWRRYRISAHVILRDIINRIAAAVFHAIKCDCVLIPTAIYSIIFVIQPVSRQIG